jgi:hypothetical protein
MERPRTYILPIAVVIAALPLLSTAQEQRPAEQPPPEEQQVFKAGAELVVLHVNVFDGRSDAVPNLPRSAFTVYEDGNPQDISFFEAGDVPVTVGLVIDNSTSMLTERDLVVAGTRAFADSSHPEDQMFAIVFNERVRLGLPKSIEFTTNRLQLIASLARFTPGGKTALYDAVIAGLEQLDKGAYQKHVLLVLSDGGDNASEHTEKEMLRRVEASSALIYTIVDPDVFTPGEGQSRRPAASRQAVRRSGLLPEERTPGGRELHRDRGQHPPRLQHRLRAGKRQPRTRSSPPSQSDGAGAGSQRPIRAGAQWVRRIRFAWNSMTAV